MSIKKKQLKSGTKYCFTLRYTDIYGNTKQYTSKGYDTQKEAKLEEAKFKIKVEEKKVSTSSITFKEAELEYLEYTKKRVKQQTMRKIENQLRVLEPLNDIKINKFNMQNWKQYQMYLESKNYSIDYRNQVLGLLRRIIKHTNLFYNTNDTMIKYIENYKRVNESKREMQFFTYDEFQKFISVIDEFNYKTFFEVLYYLGLRQGEATALTWKDINFSKKEVSINKTLTTKLKGQLYTVSTPKTVNSNRILPIPLKLLKSLERLKEQAKTKKYYSDNWFVFGDELPFRETTIQLRKNKYCKLAKVKQIRIHDFRHSCASFLINNGASIVLVSKYLGHSKISVTLDIYTHLYKNELLEVSKMIDTV